MKLVLGLGNPGKKYAGTRHNLGFLVVDRIAAEKGVVVRRKIADSLIGEWHIDGESVFLIKPQTYMNRSGQTVKALFRRFSPSIKDLVVVHDDLDLPFGRIRVRPKGKPGGHRGVLSIIEGLGSEEFYRVRVGIGRPPPGVDPTDFVLESFAEEEVSELDEVVSRAAQAVICLLDEGAQRAMEQFNRPG